MKISPVSLDFSNKVNKSIPHEVKTQKFESNLFDAFQKLESKLSTKKIWTPQELLQTQMQAHRLQLTVECTAKLAEGISATVKKLQSPQG